MEIHCNTVVACASEALSGPVGTSAEHAFVSSSNVFCDAMVPNKTTEYACGAMTVSRWTDPETRRHQTYGVGLAALQIVTGV